MKNEEETRKKEELHDPKDRESERLPGFLTVT